MQCWWNKPFCTHFSKLHQNIDQQQVDMIFNSEETFDSGPNKDSKEIDNILWCFSME